MNTAQPGGMVQIKGVLISDGMHSVVPSVDGTVHALLLFVRPDDGHCAYVRIEQPFPPCSEARRAAIERQYRCGQRVSVFAPRAASILQISNAAQVHIVEREEVSA